MENFNNNNLLPNNYRSDTALFLNEIYGHIKENCFITICYKSPVSGGMPGTSYPVTADLNVIEQEILEKSRNYDIYFEMCPQGSPVQSGKRGSVAGVAVVPLLWLDLDIAGDNHKSSEYPNDLEEALAFIYSLPWPPTFINCSGGGLHAYYQLKEPFVVTNNEDLQKAKDLSKSFQGYIFRRGREKGWKIDSTHDLARVLRVPGTFNHKPVKSGKPPQEVFIIEHAPSALYSIEDFQVILDKEVILDEICEPATRNVVPVVISPISYDHDERDYPDADIILIESHCPWVAHCHYDAATLPEPEWFAACSIWIRCKDGRSVAHERSKPYPGYNPAETDKKLDNALKAAPRTCASILSDLSVAGQYCSGCFQQGKGKSPISLGNQSPIAQAKFKMAKVVVGSQNNPKLAFEDDNLAALALLKLKSQGDYITVTNALKKAGIAKGEIRYALERFIATHEISFEEVASYEVISNCIYMNKATVHGMTPVQLCSFNAIITEDIVKNNGSTSDRYYRIEGLLKSGESLPPVTLQVQEFESMSWIGRIWGASAYYAAGANIRDNLRAAILYLSRNIQSRNIFTHTGWTKVLGNWVFLNEAGAIGKEGLVDSLTVDLSESHLSAFSLPEPGEVGSIPEAIKKCLLLLDLLPKRISFPLVSAVFRAPLGEPLPVTFALFIVGATGTRKTEVSAIAQAFFGSTFNGKKLPTNWASTANAIEKLAYLTKDTLVVIDDYLPGDNSRKMNEKADRVFRALGNQAGRQRMNSDISFHEEYYPRALIVSTAEDVPSGQSLTGRMLVLEIAEGDVDLDVLTELQQLSSQGVFTSVMYHYLQWLAPQIDDLKATLPSCKAELRTRAVEAEKTHTRTPDIIADLAIGFQSFCSFAVTHGAITEEDSTVLQKDCWTSLLEAATQQQSQQKVGDPCERFRDFLLTAFLMGKAHLEAKAGGVPTDSPETWGWKCLFGMKDDTGIPSSTLIPQGALIGWVDDKYVYLNSEGAYKVAQDVGGRDRQITTSLRTLMLRLAERKHIVSDPATGGNTIRITVMGRRTRVMQIHKSFFEEKDEAASSTATNGQKSGLVFQPKELSDSQIASPGTPQLKDALLQKTAAENLFEAFNNIFGKK